MLFSLCFRIRASIPSKYQELRSWIQIILNQLQKEREEPEFRRRSLNFYVGYCLRKKHQRILDSLMKRHKKGPLEEHAVGDYRSRMEAYQSKILRGDDRHIGIGHLDNKKFLMLFNSAKANKILSRGSTVEHKSTNSRNSSNNTRSNSNNKRRRSKNKSNDDKQNKRRNNNSGGNRNRDKSASKSAQSSETPKALIESITKPDFATFMKELKKTQSK